MSGTVHVGTGALARSVEQGSITAYTLSELMVCAAAREIKDGELVFVGMRLPLIAFVVAKKTHAPNSIGLFENGVGLVQRNLANDGADRFAHREGRLEAGVLP